MAKFTYTGDGELIIPALGLTLNKGDQFDGPDDVINLANVELASKGSKSAAATNTAPTPDSTPDEQPAPAESVSAPVSIDPTSN